MMKLNQKDSPRYCLGEAGVIPVALLLAALGVVVFLLISSSADFKNQVFSQLFPKKSSYAVSAPISGPISPSPTPTPTPTPTPAPAKRVFVTKYWVKGNINGFIGLAGANSWCKNQANQASLGGIWKAWLSNSTTSAAANIITHNNGPYKLVNGTLVANNWTDLTDGTLASKINRDQFGALAEGIVTWTNSTANGSINSTTNNCSNWTSTSGTSNSGNTFFTDSQWTKFQSDNCSTYRPLYCFEQ